MSINGILNAFMRALREPRSFLFAVLLALTAGLAACGGGGGSSSSGGSGGGSNGSGGGTASLPAGPQQQPIAATAANTVAVTVASNGLNASLPNIPTVSVVVCAQNTTNCVTVNNVQVDTASFGLRVLASALGNLNALPNESGGVNQLAECTAFADGYTWGSVRIADVKVGGETASAIPIQVIGDPATPTAPPACSNIGPSQNSTKALGANGILGIGVAPWDCGTNCVTGAETNMYYACPNGGNCSSTTVALASQVANPVAHFQVDNNGVILQMSPISNNGQASATGTLVFGIGTQSNNAMPSSATPGFQRFVTDPGGNMTATYKGHALSRAFLDSGSNGLFFADSSITPQCLGAFYCPANPLTLGATLTDVKGASGSVSFNVVSASALLNGTGNFAANDLAGQFGSATDFDLGLPFFYGRYVYYVYNSQNQPSYDGTQTPFVAF